MKPILRDFPTYFETERLIIRAPEPQDATVVNQAVIESINELRPWMAWAKENPTLEQTAENIRRVHAKFLLREDLMYLLTLKDSSSQTGKTLVGCSGLHSINWEIPSFEIGYWARSSFAGKGYITEKEFAMLNIITREPLRLQDMQEFHQELDKAKGFDTDFVRNVAYMIAEVGEVLNAYRMIDKAADETEREAYRAHVAEELADCQAYIVKLANYAAIDLESAYVTKMSHNIARSWSKKESNDEDLRNHLEK